MDWVIISLAFGSGVAGFFSPCSFVMLPGYLAYYIGREEKSRENLALGLRLGGLASVGFLLLFGLLGLLIILFGGVIKLIFPIVVTLAGLLIVLIGGVLVLDKGWSVALPLPKVANPTDGNKAVLFGVAYGLASLGCTFPVFLSIGVMAVAAANLLESLVIILSYAAGMSLLMLLMTIAASFSRTAALVRMKDWLGTIKRLSGLVLIAAGVYMVYWQYALLY